MSALKTFSQLLRLGAGSQSTQYVQVCGMKHFKQPPNFDHIELPERRKLTIMDRVPTYPPGLKPPKMQKRLRYIRGPELTHNFLLHEQYGIMALGGGRLKHTHFDLIRLYLNRKLDTDRMFALWRIDAPWQPVTKKGFGQRMGGGKGAIDHYVTPVKAGRIILELGGRCEYEEVQDYLQKAADKLPFPACAVSHEWLQNERQKELEAEKNNTNPFTMKYIIQNNMGGCQKWVSPFAKIDFGKYV